jgi:hypothetical protein
MKGDASVRRWPSGDATMPCQGQRPLNPVYLGRTCHVPGQIPHPKTPRPGSHTGAGTPLSAAAVVTIARQLEFAAGAEVVSWIATSSSAALPIQPPPGEANYVPPAFVVQALASPRCRPARG